ncbi:hypothetical protein KSS87_016976 [Heliosperma pusillum]|nr:hypothetical protein KSS87_016976 [Heliosperma pusillum]
MLMSTKLISLLLLLVLATVSATPDIAADGSGVVKGRFHEVGSSYIDLPSEKSMVISSENVGSDECEQTYGFLPCTKTWSGNMFLIMVYGYLMYLAATCLSNGSELLLEIMGPGIVGGLFLPVLGALPDAMLILVSGLSGSAVEAQSQVSVGMGLLAGSTVMLLTVIWGTCILVGKCDMDGVMTVDDTDTRGFSLQGSGVSTDIWTSYAARIMVFSVLPFLVVQLAQAFNSTSGRHLAVLVSLILSIVMLISYCTYQVYQPWIQERRLVYVRHKRVLSGFLKHILKKNPFEKLTNPDGSLNHEVLKEIFEGIDENKDNHLSKGELRAFLYGMNLEGIRLDDENIAQKLLKEFDTERQDDQIDLDEFIGGISKLLALVRGNKASSPNGDSIRYLDQYDEESKLEHLLLGDTNDEAEGKKVENSKKTVIKAVLFLVLGTIVAAVFADPLVDAVDNFSIATSIPSFFISFIALPLATNSSEAVSAIIFASKKNRRSASLTFSEVGSF